MRCTCLVLIVSLLAAGEGAPVVLQTPRGDLAPECRFTGARPQWRQGSLLIAVESGTVVARDLAAGGRQAWQASEPGGRQLDGLAVIDGHLLLRRLPRRAGDGWDFAGCGEALRLDLATGAWAGPLPATPPEGRALLLAATTVDGRLALAWQGWTEADGRWQATELTVAVLAGQRTAWTRRWPCAPSVPQPGAMLFGLPQPAAAGEAVAPLTAWGDALLVCPGATSPISAVAAADGTERWNLERLWEWDRDFIGPSVWCHKLRRFGRDLRHEAWRRAGTKTVNVTPEDARAVEAQVPLVLADWRKDFDERHAAWLAGGPWLVPRPPDSDRPQPDAILVAVAIAPPRGFVRNLARVRLYDIGERGEPVALLDLPRPPLAARPAGGLLALAGVPQGLGAVRPFPWSGPRGGMGGGPDCLLTLAWYLEPDQGQLDAWLQGGWTPPAAIGETWAVVPCDGGAVLRQGDTDLVAGLELVALPAGTRTRCSLRVRVGAVFLPSNNFHAFRRSDGSMGTVARAGFGSDQPSGYAVLGDRLIATLGERQQVVFALPAP